MRFRWRSVTSPILEELTRRYGLHLTHFQSHYLPQGWESRTSDFGSFGKIQVRLIDPYDIIAGKIFSNRPKDRDDVRLLSSALDKEQLRQRVVVGSSTLGSSVERARPGHPELVHRLRGITRLRCCVVSPTRDPGAGRGPAHAHLGLPTRSRQRQRRPIRPGWRTAPVRRHRRCDPRHVPGPSLSLPAPW